MYTSQRAMEGVFDVNDDSSIPDERPGTGDPPKEQSDRRGFYGINSVPRVEIDGGWQQQ